MKDSTWESVGRSVEVGVRISDPFYHRLNELANEALRAEGVTLENLHSINKVKKQQAAELEQQKADYVAAEKADRLSASLFMTAVAGVLPKVDGLRRTRDRESKFFTVDSTEAYHLLDSVVWNNGTPYWPMGYRYSNNSGMMVAVSPQESYYKEEIRKVLEPQRTHYLNLLYHPYDESISSSLQLDFLIWLKGGGGIPKSKIYVDRLPQSLRPAIHANATYLFFPDKKNGRAFRRYNTNGARIETLRQVSSLYDAKSNKFVITGNSPQPFAPKGKDSMAMPFDDTRHPMVNSQLLAEYNAIGGAVRLASRFGVGDHLQEVIQRAKAGSIEQVVMEQQGIPTEPSTKEAVAAYLKTLNLGYEFVESDRS